MYSMEWSHGAEYWSGVESDFGVAKVEWSAVVMCVCVTDPSLLQDPHTHTHITTALHSTFATPKYDSLQYFAPKLCSKTTLHSIHDANV